MISRIFVNLPVRDLDQSKDFFAKLGFGFNAQFTDKTAACMIINDTIGVMLLTHEKFKEFAPHPLCDARRQTEVLICLACEQRETIDAMVHNAIAAGGNTYQQPRDYGFMYQHGFQDLDGHVWELIHMDASTIKQAS